jgi:hypothetical protein
MEKSRQGGQPDVLEPANGLAREHTWSSLQLSLAAPYLKQAVFHNNDGCMIARDHAETAFLGDALAFAHHRVIVLREEQGPKWQKEDVRLTIVLWGRRSTARCLDSLVDI